MFEKQAPRGTRPCNDLTTTILRTLNPSFPLSCHFGSHYLFSALRVFNFHVNATIHRFWFRYSHRISTKNQSANCARSALEITFAKGWGASSRFDSSFRVAKVRAPSVLITKQGSRTRYTRFDEIQIGNTRNELHFRSHAAWSYLFTRLTRVCFIQRMKVEGASFQRGFAFDYVAKNVQRSKPERNLRLRGSNSKLEMWNTCSWNIVAVCSVSFKEK